MEVDTLVHIQMVVPEEAQQEEMQLEKVDHKLLEELVPFQDPLEKVETELEVMKTVEAAAAAGLAAALQMLMTEAAVDLDTSVEYLVVQCLLYLVYLKN